MDAQHACITRDEMGDIVLEDLGSTNGVVARDGRRTVAEFGETVSDLKEEVDALVEE